MGGDQTKEIVVVDNESVVYGYLVANHCIPLAFYQGAKIYERDCLERKIGRQMKESEMLVLEKQVEVRGQLNSCEAYGKKGA